MITVLLDNGHGKETPGKQSPDGRIKEYSYCRDIVKRIHEGLKKNNINSIILVPEDNDISLGERCRRANKYGKNSIFISVHLNAAGNGDWKNASGWTVWVAQKRSKETNILADNFIKYAQPYKGNRSNIKNEANFYVLKNTIMPAILTENMFQDNKKDVEFLLNNKQTIADLHINAITEYVANRK